MSRPRTATVLIRVFGAVAAVAVLVLASVYATSGATDESSLSMP